MKVQFSMNLLSCYLFLIILIFVHNRQKHFRQFQVINVINIFSIIIGVAFKKIKEYY